MVLDRSQIVTQLNSERQQENIILRTENERLQRCLNAGRRDCVKIETPPSTGVRLLVR